VGETARAGEGGAQDGTGETVWSGRQCGQDNVGWEIVWVRQRGAGEGGAQDGTGETVWVRWQGAGEGRAQDGVGKMVQGRRQHG